MKLKLEALERLLLLIRFALLLLALVVLFVFDLPVIAVAVGIKPTHQRDELKNSFFGACLFVGSPSNIRWQKQSLRRVRNLVHAYRVINQGGSYGSIKSHPLDRNQL